MSFCVFAILHSWLIWEPTITQAAGQTALFCARGQHLLADQHVCKEAKTKNKEHTHKNEKKKKENDFKISNPVQR